MDDVKPGRILVVDDTATSRYLAARILKTAGHEVIEAASGAQAIALANDEQPNVIVLDVKLPDMVGFEVTERLKSRPETAHIAILQVSASYTSADARALGLQRGADAYLTLPIEPQILLATIGALLRLHRAERALQAAVQARDAFVSMASHDLRTPIAAVQMSSELALRNLDQDIGTSELRPQLERAVAESKRLGSLLERLLDISQISTGRVTLSLESVDLTALVRDVLSRLDDARQRSGSTIEVRSSTAAVVGCWDRMRLEQILSNLVSNAIKYGNGKPIDISISATDEHATVAVRDQGVGVAPEQQRKIFRRFERAQPERLAGSYGLGLWIVKNLAEALGGSVTLDSTPGTGSVFSLRLPLRLDRQALPVAAE